MGAVHGCREGLLVLLVAGLLLPAGCIRDREGDCPPGARLVYRHDEDPLPRHVSGIIQYIFDESERLVAVDTVLPDAAGRFVSGARLAPGRYTVTGWGNAGRASRMEEAACRQEMEIRLDSAAGDSERLFYGYREFSVRERGTTRVEVDMTRAHCSLSFTIWWSDAARAPSGPGDFYLVLRDLPSRYGFLPAYRERGRQVSPYTPGMEGYPAGDEAVIHYIPVVHGDGRLVTRRVAAGLSARRLHAGLVTCRLASDSHPMLSVHDGERRLMGEIDLHAFFATLGIRLDEATRQEFDVGIEVGSDRVEAFLMTASTSDWVDEEL
jgi:hypothetical protein